LCVRAAQSYWHRGIFTAADEILEYVLESLVSIGTERCVNRALCTHGMTYRPSPLKLMLLTVKKYFM